MRAGIYVRISSDRPTEVSTQVQEEACRELCHRRGWEVVEVYLDRGISAYRDRDRPQYRRMLTDATVRRIDAIVFYKLDRLSRSVVMFNEFLQAIDEHGVAVSSVNDKIDTTGPMGRAMVQISAVFAKLESAQISMRVRGALAHQARSGSPHNGGRRAYGYARTTPNGSASEPLRSDGTSYHGNQVVPEEATVIREAAQRLLRGESLRSIATDLNRRGVRTSQGRGWHASPLAQILRSARIAGYREHHAGNAPTPQIYAGTWEPILDMDTHIRVREALEPTVAASLRVRSGQKALLSGIAVCGNCGAGLLRGRGGTPPRVLYRCPDNKGRSGPDAPCGRLSIYTALADAEVIERLLAALDSGALAEVSASEEVTTRVEQIQVALADDRSALNALNRARWVDRALSHDEWLAVTGELRTRVAERETEAARLRAAIGRTLPAKVDIRKVWNSADMAWRRDFLRIVIDRITVNPGLTTEPHSETRRRRRLDPGERIHITWRR